MTGKNGTYKNIQSCKPPKILVCLRYEKQIKNKNKHQKKKSGKINLGCTYEAIIKI